MKRKTDIRAKNRIKWTPLYTRISLAVLFQVVFAVQSWGQSSQNDPSFRNTVKNHLDVVLQNGTDRYGPRHTAMWMSIMDTDTGQPVLHPNRETRVYRDIEAPGGTTLYWDQPLVVAAMELSRLTGDKRYSEAAKNYIRSFLECCINDGSQMNAEEGVFAWGNHVYYNALKDQVVPFSGGYHELRPSTPAWELFWDVAPDATERYIRIVVDSHIYDS